jgi:hypothetical protein
MREKWLTDWEKGHLIELGYNMVCSYRWLVNLSLISKI